MFCLTADEPPKSVPGRPAAADYAAKAAQFSQLPIEFQLVTRTNFEELLPLA